MTRRYFFVLLFFSFLLSFSFVQKVSAQNGEGIKISPVRLDDLVDPGQTLSKTVEVTNQSVSQREIFLFLRAK